MARKNDTPQKAAIRELMSGYLKQNNVKLKDGTYVNAIMWDILKSCWADNDIQGDALHSGAHLQVSYQPDYIFRK